MLESGQEHLAGVNGKRLLLMLDQSGISIFTSILVALLVVLMLWNIVPAAQLVAWGVVLLVVYLSRLPLLTLLKRKLAESNHQPDEDLSRAIEWKYAVAAALGGMVWGCLGLLVDSNWPLSNQLIIPLVLAGMSAGALSTNIYSLPSYFGSTVSMLSPLIYGLYSTHLPLAASTVLVYLVMMGMAARRMHLNLLEGIHLRFHNSSLVKDLRRGVNQQDQLLKKVAESEKFVRGAFENAGVGMLLLDKTASIFKVNQAVCQLSGYSRQELLGMNVNKFAHPDDRTDTSELFARMLSGAIDSYHIRRSFLTKSGDTLWVNATLAVVRDDEGKFDYAVAQVQDVSQEQKLTERLTYQARHDALTGLANRYAFEHQLQTIVGRDIEGQPNHVLCYLDLDQFKVVNDTCGHMAGDELLRQLTRLLKSKIRKSDMLARIGGDEFALLMLDCSLEKAMQKLEHILSAMREFCFLWMGKTFTVGASIGVVEIDNETLTVTEILKQADSACYAAKEAGRDRIHVYRDDDEVLVQRHGQMQWISRIYQALENNEFVLYAQPIVSTVDESHINHYELLIRLKKADGSVVSPVEFLPAAEQYNLSPDLDLWVIDCTLTTLEKAHGEGRDISGIYGVNLSGLSLGKPGFQEQVVERIRAVKLPEVTICFEITETVAISNFSQAQEFIQELKKYGCQFALDDFGSGLSSFAYLKKLPVDYLKIDGMFIQDCLGDPINLAMVKAINEVGHIMGVRTIAEYVENKDIYRQLQGLKVDYVQGYYFGHPLPWSV